MANTNKTGYPKGIKEIRYPSNDIILRFTSKDYTGNLSLNNQTGLFEFDPPLTGEGSSGSGTSFLITQVNHGFEVGQPIYHNGQRFLKATSLEEAKLGLWVVVATGTPDSFTAAQSGRFDIGDHGLVPGAYYFVGETAGTITGTEPNGYSNPIMFVESDTIVHVLPYRPSTANEGPDTGGIVTSVFGRTGVVTAQTGDYTKEQVGLGNVLNAQQVLTSEKAQPLGVATLDGGGKIPTEQLPEAVQGGINIVGFWDALNNNPDLPNLTLTQGQAYQVSVPGSTDLNGINDWSEYDLAIWDDALAGNWFRISSSQNVLSVNSHTGAVVLDTDDIGEGTLNKYYSDALVAAAPAVVTNTNKVSADGSITTHSDVDTDTVGPVSGQSLVWNGSNWVPSYISGTLPAGVEGDILYFNGSDWAALPISTAGDVLTVNATSNAPEWGSTSLFITQGGDGVLNSLQIQGGTGTQGLINWNIDEGTLDLDQGDTVLQLGQELHVDVINQTGSDILNGTPVRAVGTLGASGKVLVAPMIANGTVEPRFYLGVTTQDILDGENGKITVYGKVRGIDTSGYNEGDILYISPTVAGEFVTTEPTYPNQSYPTAYVINVHASNGTLMVRALPDDHNEHATYAQGLLADSALQPGDNVSELTNDAGYITSAEAPVQSVNSQTPVGGNVTLTKVNIPGIENVDNTSDLNKPISTATQTALDAKVSTTTFNDHVNVVPDVHFRQDEIDHRNIQFRGTNSHAQIDTHIADTDIHFSTADVPLHETDPVFTAHTSSNITDSAVDKRVLANDDAVWSYMNLDVPANTTLATLDGTGKLTSATMPDLAITEYLGHVANEAAMLLLTGQRGDWVTREDTQTAWVIVVDGGSLIGHWQEILVPVRTVNGQTGTVALTATDVGAIPTANEANYVKYTDNLSVINDVAYTSAPVEGDHLVYTAGSWSPVAYSLVASLSDLTDVDDTLAPTDGQILSYNNVAGEWQATEPPAGITDHTNLTSIGTNTHAQIDTHITTANSHIADNTIHFTQAAISITESQISDLGTYIPTSEKGAINGVATLDGSGLLPMSQLPITTVNYLGTWNATTNTPTLADGIGTTGDTYYVSVAGIIDLGSGNIEFFVGDWAIYNGTVWQRAANGDNVVGIRIDGGTIETGLVDINIDDFDDTFTTNKFDVFAFGTIAVSGQPNIASNTYGDTLTVANSDSTLVLTTDDVTDTLTINHPAGIHDDRYYTETEVDALIAAVDNYDHWKLYTGGVSNADIASTNIVNFVGAGDTTVTYTAPNNTVTISTTTTDVDDTPVNGNTTVAISSNWAFDHAATEGISGHVPSGGVAGQYLDSTAAWTTPPNNYVNGASFNTGTGDLTLTRVGLGDLTASLDGRYLTSQSNDFGTINVTDTDSGFTWTEIGSIAAGIQGDEVTFVSGANIDIDIDTASNAVRITGATPPTVNNNTITIAPGIGMDAASGGTFTLNQGADETITLDHLAITASETTSSITPAFGDSFTAISTITTSTEGHVTAFNTKTITLPNADFTDTTYTISAVTHGSGALLRLTDSDLTTDDVLFTGSGAATVSYTDDNTITIDATNTTYIAGTGLTLSSTTFNHTDTITAGNFGDTGTTRTLTEGDSFDVTYATYNGTGHITSATDLTLTLPTTYTPSSHTLASHTDVSEEVPIGDGELLVRSGIRWINKTLAEAGIQPAGTYDNYGSWTAQDGDGTTYTITSNDTLIFQEGTGIDINFAADDTLQITNTATFPGFGTTAGTALEGDTPLFDGAYSSLTGTPSSFTPSSHSHGDINNFGQLTSTPVLVENGDYLLIADANNASQISKGVAIGTSTSTFLRNDATWATISSAITGGASTIVTSNLTANRALVSNASGKVAVSAVTSTEIGYLDGVTSSIQTQLNSKSSTSHNHSGVYVEEADRNSANGFAGLDSSGKISESQLPALAISNTFVVANQSEMLASGALVGDVAIRTDIDTTYILQTSPATTLGNWVELLTPVDGVTAVSAGDGMNFTSITTTGNVSLGTPSSITGTSTNSVTATSHTHQLADNSVGASELNVSGNGTAGQYLQSDGDGTFTWDSLATVANTGSYNDLSNLPSINNGTFTVSGTGALSGSGTFTANQSGNSSATITLSHLGIQNLTDPNADRIMFWDDSASTTAWLTAGSNLSISGTTLNATNTVYTHPTYTARSIDTTGAEVIDVLTTDTSGHVTNATKRTMTLANLGYTGDTNANNYVHPTHPGDDINLDTGALTGATVISDLDFNVTTDTSGHVTDANATYATRNLTAANVGAAAAQHSHGDIDPSGNIAGTAITPTVSDYILFADASNSGKIARGMAIGSSTGTFLRNDGTWGTPPGTSGGHTHSQYVPYTGAGSNINATGRSITALKYITDIEAFVGSTLPTSAAGILTTNITTNTTYNLGFQSIGMVIDLFVTNNSGATRTVQFSNSSMAGALYYRDGKSSVSINNGEVGVFSIAVITSGDAYITHGIYS